VSAGPWYVELFASEQYLDIMSHQDDEVNRRQAGFVAQALGVPPGSAILDLACGNGRIAVELARMGYRVTGYDLSSVLLDAARRRASAAGVDLELVHGDMRELPYAGKFDGVVSFFTSFGYFDEQENQLVLERAGRALVTGGRLLLDVINRDYLVARHQPHFWREDDRIILLEKRELDLATSRSRATWVVLDKRAGWARREYRVDVRCYSAHELTAMLRQVGLEPLAWYGDSEGGPFGRESPRLMVVAGRA